jgi:N-acetylneuraminic acid mutarotase
MGVARSEHPAVVLDDEIIVMGGLVEAGVGRNGVTSSVEAYDPALDTWRDLPDLPQPRHHGMASVVDDRVFFIGGFDETGFNPVVEVWELVGEEWVEKAPLPLPVGAGAAVTVDGVVYVVGGVPQSGLYSYDPGTDTWQVLESPTEPREHLAALAHQGRVWAIGGRWEGVMRSSVEIFDPSTSSWDPGPSLIAARSGFGATLMGDELMVAGGEVFDPLQALDSVEVLDPDGDDWRPEASLPMGVHGHPLVAIDDMIYLPGGSIEPAGVDNPGQLLVLTR